MRSCGYELSSIYNDVLLEYSGYLQLVWCTHIGKTSVELILSYLYGSLHLYTLGPYANTHTMSNTGNTSCVEYVTNGEVFREDMTIQSSVNDSFTGDWLHGYLVR